MMLPLILWDHAYGRVQDTNELPAFSSQNHRGILYTKNAQSYLMMWGAQCLRCLWDNNDNPILIDWECARKLNPTHEVVNASLDWSGITTSFNQALFIEMMRAYTAAGGSLDQSLLQAAFNGVLGNWINWMVYNIERACMEQECEQKTLGIEQVNQVLKTIVKLKDIIPSLMANITENKVI